MQRVCILDVPIDPTTRNEAVQRIKQMLRNDSFHHVCTPNSEMLVEASKNEAFTSVLQSSNLNIADSAGLLWAARCTGQKLPERVTGVDTVQQLLLSLSSEHPVFFLGGKKGVGRRASGQLQSRNPQLQVAGVYEGSPSQEDASEIIKVINDSGAHLLLVAYGAPVQDLWIAKYASQLSSVRIAMGVGGTFDFLSGAVKRSPKWMRSIGLEWLWRLLLQPSRIGRIWRAVVVFPFLILRLKIKEERGKRKMG